MKILIAKWPDTSYTFFVLEEDSFVNRFHALDCVADPYCAKYKIFDVEFFEEGIESQKQIAEAYEESDNEEQDFSDATLDEVFGDGE